MSGANNHHTHLYEFTTGNLAKRAATEVVALRPERDAARGYLPAWFHDICSRAGSPDEIARVAIPHDRTGALGTEIISHDSDPVACEGTV